MKTKMDRTNNERKNINYECNEKKIKSKKRMKKIKIIIKKISIIFAIISYHISMFFSGFYEVKDFLVVNLLVIEFAFCMV